jgi:chlorobactene glucosyltransferase
MPASPLPPLASALVPAAAFGAWSAWRANAHYLALPELRSPDFARGDGQRVPPLPPAEGKGEGSVPIVSIIIPTRDEATRLPHLLRALGPLVRGAGSVRETIVVDDASRDGTGDLARAAGARVLRLEEADRPDGWLGKPHACSRGAEVASGEWLLFLDADVEVDARAVDAALCHATSHSLDAVSLMLRQRCATFWERLLLPFAYQQLFAGQRPSPSVDQRAGEAILNGQLILVRADVYRSIGGHSAVRGSIVEDVALAGALVAAGCRVRTLRGETLGAVRMYEDLGSIRRGFGKNAYAFLAQAPLRGARIAASTAAATLTLALLAAALPVRGPGRWMFLAAGTAAWLAQAAALAPWLRRSGAPAAFALLQPLAALVFQAIALESTARSLLGLGLTWKGRTYR